MTDAPTPSTPTVVHVHNTNYATAKATATAQAVAGELPRKSRIVAYMALALGFFAVHRFYLGRSPGRWLAVFWISTWTASITSAGGYFGVLVPLGFLAVDAFLIPGWVRRHNARRTGAAAHVEAIASPDAGTDDLPQLPADAPPERAVDLRTALLRIAHRGDGKLTMTQAVMETGEDFGTVEPALHALVAAGHADVDNDPDTGVVLYLFPELVGRPRIRDATNG